MKFNPESTDSEINFKTKKKHSNNSTEFKKKQKKNFEKYRFEFSRFSKSFMASLILFGFTMDLSIGVKETQFAFMTQTPTHIPNIVKNVIIIKFGC